MYLHTKLRRFHALREFTTSLYNNKQQTINNNVHHLSFEYNISKNDRPTFLNDTYKTGIIFSNSYFS